MAVRLVLAFLILFLWMPSRGLCRDEELVPMPADIAPHHKGFIAGERHFDISNKPEYVNHFGDHYISYGRHNYDLSLDPSRLNDFPYHKRRYRGMGIGELERQTVLRKEFDQICQDPAEPWVARRAWKGGQKGGQKGGRPGLHYRRPAEEVAAEQEAHPYGFPRPSWYVLYAKKPDPWRRR